MKKIDPRRGILIALVCVFTLLLVGELALVCLYTGESSQGAMAAPADTVSREQARGRDFAPSDAEGFTPPQGGDRTGDFTPPERPEDFSPMTESTQDGIPGTLRGAWLPVVTLCVAADAVCLILLVRLKKKKPDTRPKSTMPELETEDDVRPRKSRAASWVTAVAVLLTLALILSSLPSGSTDGDTVVNTQVLSAQAETAAISTVLSGAGTLTSSDGTGAEIPNSVSVS